MPWCPKCETEYREGITVCADCGSELVEELSAEDNSEADFSEEFMQGITEEEMLPF